MNPEAESTNLGLSWTRRVIQELARRHRAVNEIAPYPGDRTGDDHLAWLGHRDSSG